MPDRRLRCHRKSQDQMKLGCMEGAKREKARKRRKGKGAPVISTSLFVFRPPFSDTSSETQGQIVGAKESLNGWENMAQKKSKERPEEPLGTMSYQTSSKRSPPLWLLIGARKTQVFWHQSEARTAATVWNWSGKTLSPGALLAVLYFSFVPYFPTRLDFPSPPLSAPGSPRMFLIMSTVNT